MIESKLKQIISKQFGVQEEKLTLDSNIFTDFNADSLDLVELVMAIEQDFKIAVEEEEYENSRTIREIIDLIESKLKK
jgi:acyl carrier protein